MDVTQTGQTAASTFTTSSKRMYRYMLQCIDSSPMAERTYATPPQHANPSLQHKAQLGNILNIPLSQPPNWAMLRNGPVKRVKPVSAAPLARCLSLLRPQLLRALEAAPGSSLASSSCLGGELFSQFFFCCAMNGLCASLGKHGDGKCNNGLRITRWRCKNFGVNVVLSVDLR